MSTARPIRERPDAPVRAGRAPAPSKYEVRAPDGTVVGNAASPVLADKIARRHPGATVHAV